MKLSITLVHDKPTMAENEAQIEELKKHIETRFREVPEYDEQGNLVTIHQVPYYAFKALLEEHEVLIMHIIPYQPWNTSNPYEAEKPANLGDLFTRGVYFGKGDEDKKGDHPRFFNWSLKRGTDIGGEVSVYIEDVTKFDFPKLQKKLTKLLDKNDSTEYAEDVYGKLATLKLLQEVGQLDESKTKDQAIIELKQKSVGKGFKNG